MNEDNDFKLNQTPEELILDIKQVLSEYSVDPTGTLQQGLHCGVEDRGINEIYDAVDYGFTQGAEAVLEAINNIMEA